MVNSQSPTRHEPLLPPTHCTTCTDAPCPGQTLTNWFDNFFSAILAVGILGAGFTFTVVFSSLEPHNTKGGKVDTDAARHFLVIAWLFFVLTVAVASFCSATFSFLREWFVHGFHHQRRDVNFVASITSLVLQLLITAAFLMSAKAVREYDDTAGKAAVIIAWVAGGGLVLVWLVTAWNSLVQSRKTV